MGIVSPSPVFEALARGSVRGSHSLERHLLFMHADVTVFLRYRSRMQQNNPFEKMAVILLPRLTMSEVARQDLKGYSNDQQDFRYCGCRSHPWLCLGCICCDPQGGAASPPGSAGSAHASGERSGACACRSHQLPGQLGRQLLSLLFFRGDSHARDQPEGRSRSRYISKRPPSMTCVTLTV
jgi:hypothetical protein